MRACLESLFLHNRAFRGEPFVLARIQTPLPETRCAMVASELRPESSVVAEVRPSPNHNERAGSGTPDMIVLHYTGMRDDQDAISHLCNPASEVSAHYVVLPDGYIVQLVAEARRAWHAGSSSWAGESDINSRSIGIEIANPGHDYGYPAFPKRQVAAVTALCRSILTRHRIAADRVLAHSDVAPSRKRDPGEKFPWKLLADSGIGLWVKPASNDPAKPIFTLGDSDPAIQETQTLLASYGYEITATGSLDRSTHEVVAAFQRHFRPQRVDGFVDASTISTLKDLIAARDAHPAAGKRS
jgi:N-acetylmuramoyl-L-alanine amidase